MRALASLQLVLVLVLALAPALATTLACSKDAPPSAAPAASASASAASAPHAIEQPTSVPLDSPPAACGTRLGDWCPSPEGDPCGKRKNVDECRADKKCKGMPYKGESLVACKYDDSGFATNCPTVGCIAR